MKTRRWIGAGMLAVVVIVATGCPGDPPPAPPNPYPPVVAVGAHHVCAQFIDLSCWGDNSSGQLGNGTTTNSSKVVRVSGLQHVALLAVGGDRTCAVAGLAQAVYCWGDNSMGGLGDGTTTNRDLPTAVIGLSGTVSSLAMGDTFSCAITSDGVMCWGEVPGTAGGFTTIPVVITGLEGATQLAVGTRHACGYVPPQATTPASVWCFGDDSRGQLGDGTATSSDAPVEVTSLSNLLDGQGKPVRLDSIAAGGDHTCAVSSQLATYWCWGANDSGQLGTGTTVDSSTPQAIAFPTLKNPPFDQGADPMLALGDESTCLSFINDNTNGVLIQSLFGCFGDNSSGQLANGTNTSVLAFDNTSHHGLTVDMAIHAQGMLSAGGKTGCYFGTSSTTSVSDVNVIKCWGDNTFGQLGVGTTTASNLPVTVQGTY